MTKIGQGVLGLKEFNLFDKRRSVPFKTGLFGKIRLVGDIERITTDKDHTSVLDTCQ